MKRVFISVPMRDRKYDDIIKSMRYLADAARKELGEDIAVINSVIIDPVPGRVQPQLASLWYLGQALSILATADFLIGTEDTAEHGFYGCVLEVEAAKYYNIKYKLIPFNEVYMGVSDEK